MGTKPSLRVYFITHHDKRLTGKLLRTFSSFFDGAPPSAYGESEEDVYAQLEMKLNPEDLASSGDQVSRYLWNESLETRTLSIEVNPQTLHKKRPIVGKAKINLQLTYAFSKMESGAYRVVVPRFGWWFVLEDLSIARTVLHNALATALLGEKPHSLYDFRQEGEEFIREWEPDLVAKPQAGDENPDLSDFPTLAAVSEELTFRAQRHKLPPQVPRDELVNANQFLFTRKPPASFLLVGEPGVGKSAFVLQMARLFASWKKEKRTAPRIWRSSADRIIAGMVYLGMWQERCLKIVSELSHEHDYLHLDRLPALLAAQPDGSSIGEILLPAAEAGEVSLIAECTEAELEKCRRKFPSLLNAFHLIRVPETPPAQMPALLMRYQELRKSKTRLHDSAFTKVVAHLDAYQRESNFPGKGFRFLDWLHQQSDAAPRTLYPKDVSEAYARFSGLPVELISDDFAAPSKKIAAALGKGVIGQSDACDRAARVLARLKAGLHDPEKPVGSLLFVGPTGVGKTELAKQLTRTLFSSEDRMVRLDMSEYMMPGSAQRLLEVGPGVRSLAERVRQQPLSLVLLDEIEKAHPEVFDLLLGILGEGRLTDSLGRLVDFRMTLVVMTSNLGVSDSDPVGYGGERTSADYLRSVRQAFRPEFFNRLDQVIPFRRLELPDILAIVDLELDKAAQRTGVVRRNVTLKVSAEAKVALAKAGWDPRLGARPLKRILEERVVAPLAVRMSSSPQLRDREIVVLALESAAYQELSDEAKQDVVAV